MVSIDFYSMEKILLKSMATINILQNIFFYLSSKETHTGLEQLEGEFFSKVYSAKAFVECVSMFYEVSIVWINDVLTLLLSLTCL